MFHAVLASESSVFCVPQLWWSLFKSVRKGYVVYTSMSAVVSNRWASAVSIWVWMLNCLELKNNALCLAFTRIRLLTLRPQRPLLFFSFMRFVKLGLKRALKLTNHQSNTGVMWWISQLNLTKKCLGHISPQNQKK